MEPENKEFASYPAWWRKGVYMTPVTVISAAVYNERLQDSYVAVMEYRDASFTVEHYHVISLRDLVGEDLVETGAEPIAGPDGYSGQG